MCYREVFERKGVEGEGLAATCLGTKNEKKLTEEEEGAFGPPARRRRQPARAREEEVRGAM
jgi:hypothetical protein